MSENSTTITIEFFGTRGSIPICDSNYQKFGGNTTSILITSSAGSYVGIIDAGTGIRNIGKKILNDEKLRGKPIVIGFTHFHWDHIQGFPFFEPAYIEGQKISLLALGKGRDISNIKSIFEVQMQEQYFPVKMDDMGASFEFLASDEKSKVLPNAFVTTNKHKHPGGAYGYRIEMSGKVVVICTDIEHGHDLDMGVVEFCKDADILVHDAQYTSEELRNYRGWGHSSFEQAIECAKMSGSKKLIMTHHDPDHDDNFLEEIEADCKNTFESCDLAREGMAVTV